MMNHYTGTTGEKALPLFLIGDPWYTQVYKGTAKLKTLVYKLNALGPVDVDLRVGRTERKDLDVRLIIQPKGRKFLWHEAGEDTYYEFDAGESVVIDETPTLVDSARLYIGPSKSCSEDEALHTGGDGCFGCTYQYRLLKGANVKYPDGHATLYPRGWAATLAEFELDGDVASEEELVSYLAEAFGVELQQAY